MVVQWQSQDDKDQYHRLRRYFRSPGRVHPSTQCVVALSHLLMFVVVVVQQLCGQELSPCFINIVVVESFVLHYHQRKLLPLSSSRYSMARQQVGPLSSTNSNSNSNSNLNEQQVQQTPPKYPSIPNNVKLLILPGFGNAYQDYILPITASTSKSTTGSNDLQPDTQQQKASTIEGYRVGSLLQSLQQRGWVYEVNVFIAPIQRWEWIKVFLYGLFDLQFVLYSNAPPTNPAFLWYLQHVQRTIMEQMIPQSVPINGDNSNTDVTNIVLVGHSAGGWLGRAAMGYLIHQQQQQQQQQNMSYRICGLVTLGTPNLPPPPSEMDMTRGALRFTDTNYPGAYQHYQKHQQQDKQQQSTEDSIFYITVCGDAIRGKKQERQTWNEPTSVTGFAYNSYKAVCGNGTEMGDGVVPICSAHLINATQQITLPNIYHSINVPEQWYGTDSVIDSWYNPMMEQIHQYITNTAIKCTSSVST